MPLTLFIRNLVITGKHGFHDHEKETPQRFSVTVELSMPGSKAPVSDNLSDTHNWSSLRDEITAIVEGKTYNLMERMAMEIAAKILEDKRVTKTVVAIDKIDAFESGIPGVRLELTQAQ